MPSSSFLRMARLSSYARPSRLGTQSSRAKMLSIVMEWLNGCIAASRLDGFDALLASSEVEVWASMVGAAQCRLRVAGSIQGSPRLS